MNDRPVTPVQPVAKIKRLRKLALPRKPTFRMLKEWRDALKNSKGPRLADRDD